MRIPISIARVAPFFVAALLAGCGQAGPDRASSDPRLGDALAEFDQGLCAAMKISSNGICQNGLSVNGLVQGGLTSAGMSSKAFVTWFDQNPAQHDVLMRYVVRCAAPEGSSYTFKDGSGVVYTWTGALGLAPGWASGKPMTAAEKQVLTACLGAHVNKYGVSVTIALEGRGATSVQLPIAADELTTFSVREACFFGDLLSSGKLYVGLDHNPWDSNTTSARACGIDGQTKDTMSTECPPMLYVGRCEQVCTPDATKTFYESCTYGGATYRPIVTRIRPSDVYLCGDGACQFTESAATCSKDCPL